MRLGKLLTILDAFERDYPVVFDFCGTVPDVNSISPHSAESSCLRLGYLINGDCTVRSLYAALKAKEGWTTKDSDVVDLDTPVVIDPPGNNFSGTHILSAKVAEGKSYVLIRTYQI